MGEDSLLAVIGGGRWARVYLSVLSAMPLPYRLGVVSRHGGDGIAVAKDGLGRPVETWPDLDALLAASKPVGAIVVNAAMSHAATATKLVAAGVPVLVEKPAVTDAGSAHTLVQAAQHAGVALVPALTYLHCAYLDNFARLVQGAGARPASVRITWADPASELRYGEQKAYDRGIGLALDVVPHIWAILASLLGRPRIDVEQCVVDRGGRRVELLLRADATRCEVVIEREAPARQRLVTVGDELAIDFSTEPGTLRRAGSQTSADPDWSTRTDRPVRRQLDTFLSAMAAPPTQDALSDLLESTRLAFDCDALVKARQRALLARTPASIFDADTVCAVQELLAPALVEAGRLQAGDRAGLQAFVQDLRARAAGQPDSDWLRVLAGEGV